MSDRIASRGDAGSERLQLIPDIEAEVQRIETSMASARAKWKDEQLARAARAKRGESDDWAPVDLGNLSEDFEPERPTIGYRSDGAGVFYSGRLNLVFGESESGKSWFVFLVAAQVLNAGGYVGVIDFEDDDRGFFERMTKMLDVPVAALDRVTYLNPSTAMAGGDFSALKPFFERCELVIIDAATEALAAYGLSSNTDVEIAAFYGALPKRIAALGPALALVDHTPKDVANRAGPQGSQHKRSGADGAVYQVKGVRPFSPANGGEGHSRVIVNKDRRGGVRLNAVTVSGSKQFADFKIEDGQFVLATPDAKWVLSKAEQQESRLDLLRHAVVRLAKQRESSGDEPFGSARKIQAAVRAEGCVKFSKADISASFLADLVDSGFLTEKYGFVRPYESPIAGDVEGETGERGGIDDVV